MNKKKALLLGAHMSVSGGYEQAIKRGESIGCTAIQIFTKSNRQWYAKPILESDALIFKRTLQQSSIRSIIAHASYLINVGSSQKATEEKSITALIDELERCELLGIKALVLHPGSTGTLTKEEGIEQISNNLNKALEQTTSSTMILLENMAGQGSAIGSTFQELALIRNNIHHKNRIGFCFDTCHAFATGYDISTQGTYNNVWKSFDTIIGLEHLKAIHLNDSKQKLGSHRDRHEHIGKGYIGLKGFEYLINDPQLIDIPKILETPKESLEDDFKNLQLLKELLNSHLQEQLEEEELKKKE